MKPSPIYIFLSALSVGATLVFANLAREDMIEKQCFSANNSFFSGLAIACAGFARYVVSEDNPYISDEEIILAKLNSKPDGYHDPNELIETLNREVGEYKKNNQFQRPALEQTYGVWADPISNALCELYKQYRNHHPDLKLPQLDQLEEYIRAEYQSRNSNPYNSADLILENLPRYCKDYDVLIESIDKQVRKWRRDNSFSKPNIPQKDGLWASSMAIPVYEIYTQYLDEHDPIEFPHESADQALSDLISKYSPYTDIDSTPTVEAVIDNIFEVYAAVKRVTPDSVQKIKNIYDQLRKDYRLDLPDSDEILPDIFSRFTYHQNIEQPSDPDYMRIFFQSYQHIHPEATTQEIESAYEKYLKLERIHASPMLNHQLSIISLEHREVLLDRQIEEVVIAVSSLRKSLHSPIAVEELVDSRHNNQTNLKLIERLRELYISKNKVIAHLKSIKDDTIDKPNPPKNGVGKNTKN